MNSEEMETEEMFKELGKNTLETERENQSMVSGTGPLCNGTCIKFKATKPVTGGRYENGQARCQTCEIWTNYRGAKLKNGEPATENSLGWYCVCCNIRLRQKPRNKKYKEKLTKALDRSNTTHGIEINNWIYDSMVLIKSRKNGILQSEIQKILSISNKDMKELIPRLSRIENVEVNDVESPSSQAYSADKKFKFIITQYDITISQIIKFIESRKLSNPQPYSSVLEKFMEFYEGFKDESFEDVLSRFIIGKSENTSKNQKSIINNFIEYTFEQLPKSAIEDKKESKKSQNLEGLNFDDLRKESKTKGKNSDKSQNLEGLNFDDLRKESKTKGKNSEDNTTNDEIVLCNNVIKYKRKIRDTALVRNLVADYLEFHSIKKLTEKYPNIKEDKIRLNLLTPRRLPVELQKNCMSLLSDPDASVMICYYSADHYSYDGQKSFSNKVIRHVEKIKTAFENNNQLRLKLMGKRI
jgi:hypothetical protein